MLLRRTTNAQPLREPRRVLHATTTGKVGTTHARDDTTRRDHSHESQSVKRTDTRIAWTQLPQTNLPSSIFAVSGPEKMVGILSLCVVNKP